MTRRVYELITLTVAARQGQVIPKVALVLITSIIKMAASMKAHRNKYLLAKAGNSESNNESSGSSASGESSVSENGGYLDDVIYGEEKLCPAYDLYHVMVLKFENRSGGFYFVLGQIIKKGDGSTSYNSTYDPCESLNLMHKENNKGSEFYPWIHHTLYNIKNEKKRD